MRRQRIESKTSSTLQVAGLGERCDDGGRPLSRFRHDNRTIKYCRFNNSLVIISLQKEVHTIRCRSFSLFEI